MICPVCGQKSQHRKCPQCGFDSSLHYEKYPTLAPVKNAATAAALRKEWENKRKPSNKWLWLALTAVAAVLLLCMGLGLGGGTDGPEETSPTIAVENDGRWKENILRSDDPPPIMCTEIIISYVVEHSVFGSEYQRQQIETVTFLDTLENRPENAWDVSAAGDGTVQAWVTPNGEMYDLYIAAEGGINGKEACRGLFAGYRNLKKIHNLDLLHTEEALDMRRMFIWCLALTDLDVSSFQTANVQDMGCMFYCCEAVTELNLKNFDTSNVQDMNNMFSCCEMLQTLNVSSFDTSKVENMAWMFFNCASLTDLDVSSFRTSAVQNMGNMFGSCESLRSLDLRSFDTSNVQNMNGMFSFCEGLTNLDLSSFDTGAVEDTTRMFYDCPAGADWQHLLK